MPGLSRDQEEDVPEHLRRYFSHFLWELSGSREMAFGNTDLYVGLLYQASRSQQKPH